MVDLSVNIGSVKLANPVMPASGTFSVEFSQIIDLNRLGALVAKTVSRGYRAGNPPPRVSEIDSGMINSIGLPTKGLKYFQDVQVAEYKRFTPPLVCSISAESIEDFAAMARDVSVPGVDAIEINISCPTRAPGGGNFALNDIESRLSHIGNGYGGISGPGVRPIIMRMVHQCSKCVKIPIIGVGGISRAEDVIEYMMAGATAVQVGYASFRNPTAMIAMIDGIEQWCEAHGVAKVSELTGSMIDHPPRDTYEAGMMGIS